MTFEGPIEDRIAIRERIEAYGDAVFQRDEASWAANWAEESVWNLAGLEVKGKSSIVAMWKNAMAGFSTVTFFANPGAIHVQGNSADVRVYTLEFLVETGGKTRRVVGQYDDKLIKQNNTWLFQLRTYRILNEG